MIDKIIAQISESRVNVINEITNKTNSLSKESSRRFVRSTISDIYDLVEQYSSFLLEPEYLKAVVDLCESLYQKVEFQFFLPRIYRISLITSTEDMLRAVICNNYYNDDASWLDDEANIDCLCKLFATEPGLIIELLKNESDFSHLSHVSILFRLIKSEEEFKAVFDAIELPFDESFGRLICNEIVRNPCRFSFFNSCKYSEPFFNFLSENKHDIDVIKTIILIHHYVEESLPKITNLFTAEMVDVLFELSSKHHRLLFLMIRRLPVKQINVQFVDAVKRKLVEESAKSTLMLKMKLISGSISFEEKKALHFDISKKLGIKEVQQLASIASILNLPQTSLSLIKSTINEPTISQWLALGQFNSVSEFFENSNNIVIKNDINKAGNTPFVSVVITTFNPDIPLLNHAIRSIVNQNGVTTQIIVVDDCSDKVITEEVKSLVEEVRIESNCDITFIEREINEGQYVCRNVAMKLAKGDYICIQDDDDISHPNRLITQVTRLRESSGAFLCYTKHLRVKENLAPCIDDRVELSILGDGPASLMFKRRVAEDIGGFRSFRSRGDIEFRERAISYYGKGAVLFINEPMYLMRSSLKSVSSIYEYTYSDSLQYYRDVIEINSKNKCIFEELGSEE